MYSGDWRISVLLYVVYLASFTFIIVEEVMYMHDLWPSFIYSSLLGVCLANPSRRLALMFFAPVFCDVLLVILQLIHAFRTAMLSGSLINTAPLLKALYKDGFIYFMAVFSLRLWSACLFSWGDSAYWYTSTYLEFALTSISASRLTLHLRKVAKRGITPPTSHLTGASLTTDSSSPERYGARKISPWTFPWTDRGDDTTTGTELTSYERGKSRHEAPLHEALEP
ncbi:hypothetical protein FRC18_000164 [Serendipita sp. 400]|nr:hypothetical protein FRC18_000164 [Serendipita sp. 400]